MELPLPMMDPWSRYIYIREGSILMVNVGKQTMPMNGMIKHNLIS